MRWFVAALLLFGAHASLTAFAPAVAGQAWVGWPFAADARPMLSIVGGLPQQGGSTLTPLLAGVAGIAFLAALLGLFGWWIPANWWGAVTLTASSASLLLFVLYLGPYALLPVAVDLTLLWGILLQHWSVAMLRAP